MSIKKQIPNIFTLLNLFCGCWAIVNILQTKSFVFNFVSENQTSSFSIPENIALGAILIFVAAIIDFLDGFVARFLKAESELGAQLDSLSDVVSFGVAPSCILFQILRSTLFDGNDIGSDFYSYCLPVFVFAMAGAYRLARFNTDKSQSVGFKGLPIPSAGLVVASLPLVLHYQTSNFLVPLFTQKFFIYGITFLLSFLMVSKIPLMALKFKNFAFKDNLVAYCLIFLSLILIIFLQWASVFFILVVYILISLYYYKFSNKVK